MALVMDHKYPIYYDIPNETEIGLINFQFDAPIIAGDLASIIANALVPQAVATQGGQVSRIKVWKNQINPVAYRWITEFHVFFPQELKAKLKAKERGFAISAILAAIGSWLAAHAGQILAIVGIYIILNQITSIIYGPPDAQGNREKPKIGPEQFGLALLMAAGGIGLLLYLYRGGKKNG